MTTPIQLANPWLPFRLGDRRPLPRLLCFHAAGGSAADFRTWGRGLPSGLELCAVQLPGRRGRLRESPLRRADELARAVARALEREVDLPYALFGHSLGALLAFEVARELRRLGLRPPMHLFASARAAPQVPLTDAPLHRLPTDLLLSELHHRYGGLSEEALSHSDAFLPFLRTLRADLEVHEMYRYAPEPPLSCPISAFGGASDRSVGAEGLRAWERQATGPFRVRWFAGGHFYVKKHERAVVAAVAAELEEALTATCTSTG